jgi:predicted DNA-binding transcriptional regulator AlpA
MSDIRVTPPPTPDRQDDRTDTHKIRIPGPDGTHHTNPSKILAQNAPQRAANGSVRRATPDRHIRASVGRTASRKPLSGTNGSIPGRGDTDMARLTDRSASLTIPELIIELKVSRSTFYYWRQTGKAPRCLKLPNGEIRVRRVDLDTWLDSLEEVA